MRRPNAVEAGLNVYRSQMYGINDAAEAKLTSEDWILHIPVLNIGGALDPLAPPGFLESTKLWAKAGYESKTLNGGHWLSWEKPQELSQLLIDFGRA